MTDHKFLLALTILVPEIDFQFLLPEHFFLEYACENPLKNRVVIRSGVGIINVFCR